MFKVLIWGTGAEYSQYINCIRRLEEKGQIEVVGVVSNDLYIRNSLDGYRFIRKEDIASVVIDYCFIAVKNMMSVLEEAKKYGIIAYKCIPVRVTAIPGFDFSEYIKLKGSNISIFSSNCWAGICYHYLGLPFLSPTINMFESAADFNKMMKNLDYYMGMPVDYIKDGIETDSGMTFPIAKIDDIILNFLHYENFDNALFFWEKRKKRINKKNTFVLSYTDDKKELFDFEDIPFEYKIIFTSCKETSPSAIYVDKSPWGALWQPVIASSRGEINLIDIISLLNHNKDYIRVK